MPAHRTDPPDDDAPEATPWVPLVRAPTKGRGAVGQVDHRFTGAARAWVDDGWAPPGEAPEEPAFTTQVTEEQARSAISRHGSPDLPFHQGLNPYRGCEHGCIYCYARPTHAYLGWSPGLDFETRLIAKTNLPEVLRAELQRPGYVPSPIMLGSVTDGYQPIERAWGLTRRLLEVLAQARHPVAIVTKGAGVERDLDLLAPMAAQGLVSVHITLTTLDAALARTLEPRAAAPHRRLRTMAALAQAGVPVGVSLSPQIPFLNDDLEQVLAASHAAGARQAFYAVLRLPWEVAPLFEAWLHAHYPDRAQRVMERVRDLHGIDDAGRAEGKAYRSTFGQRMKGTGVWSALLAQRFQLACRKLGFNRSHAPLDCTLFDPALLAGQQRLF